jgi:CD2 antigen cytoplasmic tail-binding protein 2
LILLIAVSGPWRVTPAYALSIIIMPGQKRSAASAATPSSEPATTKKTRFLDPSEDPANFADQVDAALENPSASRKGRVRTDGYDSDSSDDGEGVRPKDQKQDDDDDMFAIGDKANDEQSPKKKEEQYLRLGDIEGQEFNDDGDDDQSASESDAEPEDEDDAERRKKAGMGFELSSFNMREEMEEGKFTEDGSYVRTFDAHAVHDRWMDGIDEKEIKLARRRKRHQEKLQEQKIEAEEKELEQSGGLPKLEGDLLPLLKKGETVLEALQRLGIAAKKEDKKSSVFTCYFLLKPFYSHHPLPETEPQNPKGPPQRPSSK